MLAPAEGNPHDAIRDARDARVEHEREIALVVVAGPLKSPGGIRLRRVCGLLVGLLLVVGGPVDHALLDLGVTGDLCEMPIVNGELAEEIPAISHRSPNCCNFSHALKETF